MQVPAFETLADPTRRSIIEVLQAGERPVGEIVAAAGVHQSGVSRHLRILHEAGFVERRADGQRRLYSLRKEPFAAMRQWLDGFEKLWEERLDRFDVALKRRQKLREQLTKSSASGADDNDNHEDFE